MQREWFDQHCAKRLWLPFLVALICALSSPAIVAQTREAPSTATAGVVPDDELTLVTGTRFVRRPSAHASAKARFTEERIPLSDFNKTDHCIDENVLEVAKDYFTNLGRELGKAGYFYFLPLDEIKKAHVICEKIYQNPPQVWSEGEIDVIAFGRVVPTVDAPALEKTLR